MAIAVVVVVGAGAWWYFGMPHGAAEPQGQSATTTTPAGPDTSDQAIAEDAANLSVRVAGIPAATSTAGLPAQVAATQSVADQFANVALKFSMRLAQAGTSSPSVATLQAALSDLNSQVADAHTQSSAALGHIANATAPDTSAAITKQEYDKAAADMRVAGQDFAAAEKDITALMQGLGIAPASGPSATSSVQMGVVELR